MRRRPRRFRLSVLALILLILLFVFAVLYASSFIAQSRQPAAPSGTDGPANTAEPPAPYVPSSQPAENTTNLSGRASSSITIATFNIQVFGESKRSKPEVMDVLVRIARRYDLIVVQELRDDTQTTLPYYVSQINTLPGPQYSSVSSPPLGRTSSKENYAFIYNNATLRLISGSNYTFQDPPAGNATDLFQREPFIARFETISGNETFDFAIITIHTDPDTTPEELAGLPIALDDARQRFPDERDFIMLGDMNADCSYLSAAEASPLAIRNSSFLWIVPDDADTTVKSSDCAYDRIILADSAASRYLGEWGVFRFDQEYGLNQTFAESVSDHYPVWVRLNLSG